MLFSIPYLKHFRFSIDTYDPGDGDYKNKLISPVKYRKY